MTREGAIRQIVSQVRFYGVETATEDEDETSYSPRLRDLEVLSALVGRPVTEKDLNFYVGGMKHGTYTVRDALLREIL